MSINEIISLLDNDPSSSDFLISILWAAATNYKHDTLLRPFPPQYIREEQKDVDTLVKFNVIIATPCEVKYSR